MTNDRVAKLSKQAMEYAAEQYGPQRAGEMVWDPLTYDRKFAELIAADCIAMIQLHMPRNGVSSPENVISKRHINNIADLYGVALPLPASAYEDQIANIMAGADQMEGDGGYKEVSLKTPEFLEIQARHHALYAADETLNEKAVRLRELTNYPIMECKKALTACNEDFEKAAVYIRDWPWLNRTRSRI